VNGNGNMVARLSVDLRAVRAENERLRRKCARYLDQTQKAVAAGEHAMAGWHAEMGQSAQLRLRVEQLERELAELTMRQGRHVELGEDVREP
jgi:hypothetical protein